MHPGKGRLVSADRWARLHFLVAPQCDRCALPQDLDLGEDTLCAACLARPPAWDRGRAAVAYDEGSRDLVLALKHGGQRDRLDVLATWMHQAGRDLLDQADWLVPVPLHPRRLFLRGFNQAAWLSQAVGRKSGCEVMVDGLMRTRATPSQGGLSGRARRRNVSGAFALSPRGVQALAGTRIILVDDVLTTGATLTGCTRALLRGGAAQVDVLVLARVVRARDVTI